MVSTTAAVSSVVCGECWSGFGSSSLSRVARHWRPVGEVRGKMGLGSAAFCEYGSHAVFIYLDTREEQVPDRGNLSCRLKGLSVETGKERNMYTREHCPPLYDLYSRALHIQHPFTPTLPRSFPALSITTLPSSPFPH